MTADPVSPANLNLYELARMNGENIRERYESTRERAGDAADALERFCQRVERDGRVAINTKSTRFLSMLRNGYYPNPYDEARERAQREGGDSETYLKQQQNDFYLRRVTFERTFADGENFRYASLNIGGTGLSHYGPYCIVIGDPTEADRVALLPANSLKRFMSDEPKLDQAALRREVAPWLHRHHLTACKHAHEVAEVAEVDWPRMMCHAAETVESFVEIILGSPVTPRLMVEIRVDEKRLDELVAKSIAGMLSDAERTEANARLEVFEELAKQNFDTLYRAV